MIYNFFFFHFFFCDIEIFFDDGFCDDSRKITDINLFMSSNFIIITTLFIQKHSGKWSDLCSSVFCFSTVHVRTMIQRSEAVSYFRNTFLMSMKSFWMWAAKWKYFFRFLSFFLFIMNIKTKFYWCLLSSNHSLRKYLCPNIVSHFAYTNEEISITLSKFATCENIHI